MSLIGFVYGIIKTGSLMTSFVIVGIGLALLLLENIFDLISLFGSKENDKPKDNGYEKAKKDLKKVTDNNPTLR